MNLLKSGEKCAIINYVKFYHIKHYDQESKRSDRIAERAARLYFVKHNVAVSGLFQRTPKFTCEWSRRRLGLVSVDAVPALWEKRMLVLRGGYYQAGSQSCPVSGKAVFV